MENYGIIRLVREAERYGRLLSMLDYLKNTLLLVIDNLADPNTPIIRKRFAICLRMLELVKLELGRIESEGEIVKELEELKRRILRLVQLIKSERKDRKKISLELSRLLEMVGELWREYAGAYYLDYVGILGAVSFVL